MTENNQLKAFIERLERMDGEKDAIAADIKEIYGEAKSVGYDTKIIREVLRIRKQDPNERSNREAILDTYLSALGMTPMEEYINNGD